MSDEKKPPKEAEAPPDRAFSAGGSVFESHLTREQLAEMAGKIGGALRPLVTPDSITSGWLEDYKSSRNASTPQTWMACERPGCCHDITTDHEDGFGRCVRLGCACEAALVRVSTVLAMARGRRT